MTVTPGVVASAALDAAREAAKPHGGLVVDACPTCSAPGVARPPDGRGVLVEHPHRAFPCRVADDDFTAATTAYYALLESS